MPAVKRCPNVRLQFTRYLRRNAGTSSVMFALALPAVLGGIGVAIDFGVVTAKQSLLQSAADQAAIAAVKEFSLSNATPASIAAAADSVARSIVSDPSATYLIEAVVDKKQGAVAVTVKESWTPFFAHFLGAKMTPIVVHATAQLAGQANLCVLTLDGSSTKALHMDKSARLTANGCAVYSNSSHVQSIRLDQNSSMKAAVICAVGGVKAKTSAVEPAPTTDCPVISDPLAPRVAPVAGSCDYNKTVITTGITKLSPGHYCKGLKISGDATVNLEPGTYIISGGPLEMSGKAHIVGNHVGFFLNDEKTILKITNDAHVDLTGETSGALAGMLFFEDRSVSVGRTHLITSSEAHRLEGTIYLSRGNLEVSPNAPVADDSAYTAIVVNKLMLNEGPELVLNSNYGGTDVPVPDGIRLSTQVVLSK
jgi:Flp pilus assembly protein TadG